MASALASHKYMRTNRALYGDTVLLASRSGSVLTATKPKRSKKITDKCSIE